VQQGANLAAKVERFKKSAASVSTWSQRREKRLYFVCRSRNQGVGASRLRAGVRYRIFWLRRARATSALVSQSARPPSARSWWWYRCSGWSATVCARPARRTRRRDSERVHRHSPDIDKYDCWCFKTSELLWDKTLEEIEVEVKDSRWFLARAEKDLAVARRYACLLMQKRCRLRKRCLSAMGNSANARGLRFESKRNRQSG